MANETSQKSTGADLLHRYVFDQLDCRGELVQLNQSLNQVFANHQYPAPVKQLLAELMAATALLTATLKFKGDISVQIQGNGPVGYAVVNGNDQLQMRAMARIQGEIGHEDLQSLVGKAHMVFTITPDKGERYQGVVMVEGETIAKCIEDYFKQSEQLKTRIWIAADLSEQDNRAAALFLQVLPVNKVQAEEDFTHLATLTATVKPQELLELDAATLLTRLYHQDNPTVFEPQPISFKCGCSREKTAAALASMDHESLLEQIEQQGPINVDCQFCLARYSFDSADVNKLHRQS